MRRSIVYVGGGWLVYAGRLTTIAQHRHPAAMLCFGLAAPFLVDGPDPGAAIPMRSAYVPADAPVPWVDAGDQPMGLVICSADNPFFYRWQRYFDQPRYPLPDAMPMTGRFVALLRRLYSEQPPAEEGLGALVELSGQALSGCQAEPIDERVRRVIHYLWHDPDGGRSLEDLAEAVSLSPTRLLHVFKRTTGITLRRYRMWVRMVLSARLLRGRPSFTDIAHAAGFADSAHLSHTFRKLFGTTPTEIVGPGRQVDLRIADAPPEYAKPCPAS